MSDLTPRERDALVAVVNGGGYVGGAAIYGASKFSLKLTLASARRRLDAVSTTHAVALAFRELRDRFVLPCDPHD